MKRIIIDYKFNDNMKEENNGNLRSADKEDLRLAYKEVCISYHKIDDIRIKLLGFLPLTSISGLLYVLSKDDLKENRMVIGIFGIIITVALFIYVLRGIQQCMNLIRLGCDLEKRMAVNGQFVSHKKSVWSFFNEPIAVSIVYPAVVAKWSYIVLDSQGRENLILWSSIIFGVGFGSGCYFYRKVRKLKDKPSTQPPQYNNLKESNT